MSSDAALNGGGKTFKQRQEDAKKKQSGEMAPDVDQDGKIINPHNPDFITRVPWYLGDSGPTLKHHNIQKSDHFLSLSEADQLIQQKLVAQKQIAQTSSRTVFKKGACKNCGATTHKEKDCVERPRSMKKSAWKSGLDIAPDDVVLKLEDHGKVSFAAKRDQWKGYDPEEYKEVRGKHAILPRHPTLLTPWHANHRWWTATHGWRTSASARGMSSASSGARRRRRSA